MVVGGVGRWTFVEGGHVGVGGVVMKGKEKIKKWCL